jgi:hypothetical protein
MTSGRISSRCARNRVPGENLAPFYYRAPSTCPFLLSSFPSLSSLPSTVSLFCTTL